MAAMLLTLMSPALRGPLVANMLRSRGGATMAAANAQVAPSAVPLTSAVISASTADVCRCASPAVRDTAAFRNRHAYSRQP